ncbi:helix-turn-helix domain-containing protein [Streptomyces californicus]|uniref:Helix-turn-helix domain-containing protein n=1 Tax=Streptomyces californicus TaxID=67351 RepID=A0ABD7CZS1_9ACTN|nr:MULTISPECIES: helix-turn-helix transcriptional regulator [Streptomyces]NEC43101.1 helix-turn-helix domain-containing protein [Streptomyces sp. SID8016]MCF3167822.1 helix-turn-helix domain-containing protein [Streptomyces violaceoruber]QRV36036.1 helix-turn-helix domain-containing protein [Streptomyces californicus]QRV41697.1 helix-turn-helix domain-containing protein [Streptomyces californicus]QRV48455.1 helix-turn-helix domain-containing protein [Streptomyces californicus]
MASHPRPTVRRRRVGAELKRLREKAGVRMEDAAERIGGDKPKISRQENGRQGVSKLEIEALLELYGVSDDRLRTALITLAREGRRKGWWAQYSDILSSNFQERLSIEADTARILSFQPMLVPGLLQTVEYATQVIRSAGKNATEEQIASYIDVRRSRQEIFTRENPPQFVCLLDEAVLHREIGGPAVMAAQLGKILEISNPPKLTIQVVPFAEGWHAGADGAFNIYSYPDPMDLDVVNLEYLDGALYLEEDESVERYQLAFEELRTASLTTKQSMELVSSVQEEFAKRA